MELDKFSEKNALCVDHNMRANTIILRHKNTVKSKTDTIYWMNGQRTSDIFPENSHYALGTARYVPYHILAPASDTTAPKKGY